MAQVSRQPTHRARGVSGSNTHPSPQAAPPQAPRLRPTVVSVVKGVLTVAKPGDARVSRNVKKGYAEDALGAHFHEIAKRFVCACISSGCTHEQMSKVAGMASKTLLAHCLEPKMDRNFRFVHLMKLLAWDHAPRAAVLEAMGAMARECGLVVCEQAEAETPAAAVQHLGLEASDVVGKVNSEIRAATAPGSPGGVGLTPAEARRIAARAGDVAGVAHGIVRAAEEAARGK
ncbi:MAG: hypothetical protein ACREJO_03465 [Phycisphaerales bacterium]